MNTPYRTQKCKASVVLLLQLLGITALAPNNRQIGTSEAVPSFAQTGRSASNMETAHKLNKFRALYLENPVMFLQTLDQKLAEKQAMMQIGGLTSMRNVPEYPFEPLMNVDVILDAANYLEDFINATEIPKEIAAQYIDTPALVGQEIKTSPQYTETVTSPSFAIHGNSTSVTENEKVPHANMTDATGQTTQGRVAALAQKIGMFRADVQKVLAMVSDGVTSTEMSVGNFTKKLGTTLNTKLHDSVSFQQRNART